MGLSSHQNKNSTNSAKFKAESLSQKNPSISECVASAEKSVAGRLAGSRSVAWKTSSSSNRLPLQTALAAKPQYTSQGWMSRGRGLLELKGSCVCESVVSVEETKLTKKDYLAISTKGQTPHVSNTRDRTIRVKDLDQRLRASDWNDVKYKRRTSCSSGGASPPLQNLASSWSSPSARADYVFSRADYAKPTLSPGTNTTSPMYNPNPKVRQSIADSYKLVEQPQEAIVSYHEKVAFAAIENSIDIDQNTTDKNFMKSRSSLSKMQDDESFASGDANMGRINAFETTEIASHEEEDSWYSPPIVRHSAERSSPSSASLSEALNFEDRWKAPCLSHVQNVSTDSVQNSRSFVLHSTADTGPIFFHKIGSTLTLSPETSIPFTNGSRRMTAWPIRDEDKMLATRASNSDAVRKLDNSFRDCRPSLGLHNSKKELHGNGQVEASRIETCIPRSPIKTSKTFSKKTHITVLKFPKDCKTVKASTYACSKAAQSAKNLKNVQDSSGFLMSNRPSSKGAVRFVKCSSFSGTATGELSATKSYLDSDSIAIRRVRQASQYCLPAHRPQLHTLLKSLTLTTKSDSFQPVGSSASVIGLLECILTEETLSFRFCVASSKETLIAETCKGANIFKKGDPLFTFLSRTGKGKVKAGWKRWHKKQRHSIRIIGEMKATTGGQCTVDCDGKPSLHSELEFVLLGEGVNQMSSYILDEKKCNRSLAGLAHVSSESSQISPRSASHPNSPELGASSREENAFNDSSSVTNSPDVQIENESCRSSSCQLELSKDVGSLSHQPSLERWQKSCEKVAFDENVRVGRAARLKTELSAMLIQLPTYSQIKATGLGGDADLRSKLGWDINFVRQGSISSEIKGLPQSRAVCSEMLFGDNYHQENLFGSLSSKGVDIHSNSAELEFRKYCEEYFLSSTEDGLELKDVQEFRNAKDERVTIILPAGEHGCPTTGLEGPQPLIRRWRSGGKCDCGNWDLGCGLVILKNEQSCGLTKETQKTDGVIKHNQDQHGNVEMFIQDRKQKEVAMSLWHLQDGLFSLCFQEPMSSLQAFAAAVAILYCRLQPTILSTNKEKRKYAKMKPPRVPFRTIKTSNSHTERASPWRCKAYTRGCHLDPPLNPVDRA